MSAGGMFRAVLGRSMQRRSLNIPARLSPPLYYRLHHPYQFSPAPGVELELRVSLPGSSWWLRMDQAKVMGLSLRSGRFPGRGRSVRSFSL